MNDGPICEITELPQAWCAHCRKTPELETIPTEDYTLAGRTFTAMYSGRCAIDPDHTVRRGDTVAYVKLVDNPMLPVPGVACAACVRVIGWRQ